MRLCLCNLPILSFTVVRTSGSAKIEPCGQDPRLMTGKRVGIEHTYKVIPIYPIPWNHCMAANAFELIFHQRRCLLQQRNCGEVLIITSSRFCRLLCLIGIIESSERAGYKLYSLEVRNTSYAASLCTQTLYVYDFSIFVLENGSSASLFVLSADYKPKKIKTEDIKKVKKRKQEEEEVM